MFVNLGLSGARGGAADKRLRQQGFTLIELSIVLTIIGLIVGGILKGQELINNARIKTQVAQIDNIKSAVLTFQDRYGFLPGDFNNAASLAFTGAAASTNGDGNGAIAAAAGTSIVDTATVTATESIMVWPELTAANLVGGFIVPGGTNMLSLTNADTASYLPGKITSTYLWLATYTDAVYPTSPTLAVRLQQQTAGAAGTTGLKESDMSGIDSKYDDGLPFSGSISVVDSANVAAGCASAASLVGTYTTTAANAGTAACVPLFFIQ